MDALPERSVVALLVVEVGALLTLALVLAGSFTGHTATFSSVAPVGRLALVAAVVGNALVPLWVYYDVKRTRDSMEWVHVALCPVVNLFGLVAYLDHRKDREP